MTVGVLHRDDLTFAAAMPRYSPARPIACLHARVARRGGLGHLDLFVVIWRVASVIS